MAFDILRPLFSARVTLGRNAFCAFFFGAFALLIAGLQPAMAEVRRFAFELPVYGDVEHESLAKQVEPFVAQVVARKFRQYPQLSVVEIVITVNRNGDVMPLLTIKVSREQWRKSAQMKSLMRYHSAYADFQRPQLQPQRRLIATARQDVVNWRGGASRIEISLDRGRLSARQAQRQLSDLD